MKDETLMDKFGITKKMEEIRKLDPSLFDYEERLKNFKEDFPTGLAKELAMVSDNIRDHDCEPQPDGRCHCAL